MNQLQQQNLKEILEQIGFTATELEIKKMSGGAIQENWSITSPQQELGLVLRKNANTTLETSSGREQEYILLEQLYGYGVTVPEPLYFGRNNEVWNSDFFIMKKVSGVTEGHKLVRLNSAEQQTSILNDIGQQLGKIHSIKQDATIEEHIKKPELENYLTQLIQQLRQQMDDLNRHQPILEYAIQWMFKHTPAVDDLVLIHGDYRTGNIMVNNDKVTGILDWEFTHWGDRREDIGWFTAKCWRFGQDQNLAGGIGAYKDFMQAYAEITDIYIPEFELKFWHILAHVRWAVIAMQQAHRNQGVDQPSLELGLTDYLVPLLEKNILDLLEDKE